MKAVIFVVHILANRLFVGGLHGFLYWCDNRGLNR